MTLLPEKQVLDGTKEPKTTTLELKQALGKIRDYLAELLGSDSADKEAARRALGIELTELMNAINGKMDPPDLLVADPTALAVRENAVYQFGEIPALHIVSLPDSHRESTIYFTSGATATTLTLDGEYRQVGELTVEPNTSYVLSIQNKIVILGQLQSA